MKKLQSQIDLTPPIEPNSDFSDRFQGSNPALSAKKRPKTVQFYSVLTDAEELCHSTVPEKYPYKLAKIVDHDGDMSKRWYVDYRAWDVSKEVLVRVRQFEPLNREKNRARRMELADHMVRVINGQLRAGKCLGKDKISHYAKFDFRKSTVAVAINFFLEQKKIDGLRKSYLRNFNPQLINSWAAWLEDRHIGDFNLKQLDQDDLYSFFGFLQEKRKISNKTFNNYRNNFSTFYNWMRKRYPQILKVSPFEGIRTLRTIATKHAAYSDEQMKAIKKKCIALRQPQLLLYINFIYYSMVRPSELRMLKVSNIDLKENRIFISGEISKNHCDEFVPIAPALKKIIQGSRILLSDPEDFIFSRYQKPGAAPIRTNNFWKRNCRLLKSLEFTDRSYDVYSYKHSGAISLYKSSKDIKLVQRQCRHTTIEQTNTYLRDLGLLTDYEGLKAWKGAL